MKDFFISYTKTDEGWAEWIAWQLEEAGHSTVIQAWDFHAGQNVVLAMQEAASNSKQTIAILSPDYLRSDFAKSEWSAAFAADPAGKEGKLIPIKVRPVDVKGILGPIIHIDLISLSKKDASERLLTKTKASEDGIRAKPESEPNFPGESSPNANPTAIPSTRDNHNRSISSSLSSQSNGLENTPAFKAGLVDKDEQATHVIDHLGNICFVKEETHNNPLVYLLYGASTQWPDALLNILYYQLNKILKRQLPRFNKNSSPTLKYLSGRILRGNIDPVEYLYELLDEELTCGLNRKAIERRLSKEKVPLIFYRILTAAESTNPALVQGMLVAWQKLELSINSPRHILIFYYEYIETPKPSWNFFRKSEKTLINHLKASLPTEMSEKIFLPRLKSPNKKLVHDWISIHISQKLEEAKKYVEDKIRDEYKQRKEDKNAKKDAYRIRIAKDDYEIHHHDLKNILIDALNEFC